jgi:hypothetical protein
MSLSIAASEASVAGQNLLSTTPERPRVNSLQAFFEKSAQKTLGSSSRLGDFDVEMET